ncbi:substrate-binding domain-containing protein [Solirubrobacter ginsenosidimutans]|uniref:Substrate-binding domain-containing protein n=1 Tax=Solirubrobacter ginsenosidimutans TaxID=490573 RepID=A0A9X3MS00_9ACTN|nr:substrate-binding domain-containing protein [Solirubrobacter ginsenosidimutans]MDA0161410.1 substrate-binding domain-containing protein [Solirubrobacter ginsenosidimutans]
MSSFGLSSQRRRLALSVAGALAATVVAAPAASAQFTLAPCQGGSAVGQGSSFQGAAFTAFKKVFSLEVPSGCGAAGAGISYSPTSSGAGRIALGQNDPKTNPRNDRNQGFRWAGTDEAPKVAERASIEGGPIDANGQDVTAADNAKLHVVPIAIGAIAVLVHLPDGCTGFGAGADLYNDRPKVTLQKLEAAFYGANSPKWSDLIPGLTPAAGCGDVAIKRAVRADGSGTTFALKQLLQHLNPAHANEWRISDNPVWPTAANATVTGTGGGGLATTVATTAGTLGYVDLATARGSNNGAFLYDTAAAPIDKIFWLPLQQELDGATYSDPQTTADGYKTTTSAASVKGANCNVEPVGLPTTPADDLTYGLWTSADATLTGDGYAACTMTYDMVFDDNSVAYCKSADEEAKARTIKDYLTRGVLSDLAQAELPKYDYDRLPTKILTDISRKAVDSIGWNKGGQGRPCSTPEPEVTPTPTPVADPGPGTPTVTPPPPAPSNAITVASSRVSGTSIRFSLQLPGAGKISIASSTKPKKGKTIKLATKTVTATKSGTQTITLSLSSKAKSALKKDKKLKVTVKITYTPTGGTAKTITKTVTVKQPKKKSK